MSHQHGNTRTPILQTVGLPGTYQLWFHGEAKVKEVKVEDISDVDGDLDAVGEQAMQLCE